MLRRPLWGLFLAGALLRFYFAYSTEDLKPDEQYRYVEIAQNLRHGGGFSIQGHPTAQVMPAWPYLLSRLPEGFKPNYFTALLSTVAILLAWFLAAALGTTRFALIVVALMALDLDQARLGGRLLTEPLFTVLLLWFAVAWVRRMVVVAALALGLACLTRPEAFLIPFAMVLFSRELKRPAILLAGVVVALSPWAWRNWHTFGEFIPFTTTGGITFHSGMNELEAKQPMRKKGTGQQARYPSAPALAAKGERKFDREYFARGFEFVLAHPWEAAKITASKAIQLWTPVQRKGHSALYGLAILLALWACASRVRFAVPLVGPLLFVMTFVGLTFLAIPRYRVPYHPYVFLLAAAVLAPRRKAA